MLPVGLHVKAFKSIKKIPMRLGTLSLEEQTKHFYKMLNIEKKEEQTRKRKVKKNKTKKFL
jgi:hypothetical protein